MKEIEIDKTTLKMIFNAIRTSFKRSDIYKAQLYKYLSKVKGPKGGERFDCCLCKKPYTRPEIEMDHYPLPVVPLNKYWYELSVEDYYKHVFYYSVRLLCKSCHKNHTKNQKKDRKKSKETKK